jgi:tetratricopeptide (TPR) repeat protein
MDNARAPWDVSRVVAKAARVLIVLLTLAIAPAARAAADAGGASAAELFQRAEDEDAVFDFAHALEHYDAARALDSSGPNAARAEARADALRGHAEGGFAPLRRLEQVRRDPALASDPEAIDALARAADDFPPGRVRVEAWALVGEAYANRLGRPDDAARCYRKILGAADADPVLAKKAARDLVTLATSRGDLAGASAAVALAGERADPKLARDVERLVRRRHMHIASILVLAATALLAGRACVTAARRGAAARVGAALRHVAPLAIGGSAYVALAGGVLASRYEAGTGTPFFLFGAALVPILLVARAWGAAGASSRRARAARAVACAASALCAAFLVLETLDARYLEGMGL